MECQRYYISWDLSKYEFVRKVLEDIEGTQSKLTKNVKEWVGYSIQIIYKEQDLLLDYTLCRMMFIGDIEDNKTKLLRKFLKVSNDV